MTIKSSATLIIIAVTLCSNFALTQESIITPQTLKELKTVASAIHSEKHESYITHTTKGEIISTAFASLTGEAVNPLFGVTIRSIYIYFKTDNSLRAGLPWFYQPKFWLPMALLILAMIFKGTIAEANPILKKPLDAISDLISKGGALVSLPIIVSIFANQLSSPMNDALSLLQNNLSGTVYAADGASMENSRTFLQSMSYIISCGIGTIIYLIVFISFNTFEALILISPFPAVDAGLKSIRIGVIGFISASTTINPWAGAIISAITVLICLIITGWAFRLSVFSFIYSTDIIFFRSRWTNIKTAEIKAFSNIGIKKQLPIRTYGKLTINDNILVFNYRPWLVLPKKTLALKDERAHTAVGKGLINNFIITQDKEDAPILRLPPRYNSHEETIKQLFSLSKITDISILRGINNLFKYIKSKIVGDSQKI